MDDREARDRFMLLIEEYRLAGWIGLGKIRSPQADDARPDLALARHAIDTLGMLEVKTRGNRNDEEERLLRQTLADLRINFADEVKRGEDEMKAEAEGKKRDEKPPTAPGEPVQNGPDVASSVLGPETAQPSAGPEGGRRGSPAEE